MEELDNTFIEEYAGAVDEKAKGRFKNSAILFSKAMFALCDILIYEKFNKLPKNHAERFRILQKYFEDTYFVVDDIFGHYTDAYSKPVLGDTCDEIQAGIREIANENKISDAIKEVIG